MFDSLLIDNLVLRKCLLDYAQDETVGIIAWADDEEDGPVMLRCRIFAHRR